MKILFAWEWGTGSGHLRRFVPLASFLRDAGHQVTIVAKELQVIRPIRNPLLRVSDSPLRLSGISPACDLVICNGNHGTSAKALSQGIPVFAIPLFLEQRVTAARLQRESWGVSADPQRPDLFVPKAIESTHDSTRDSAARYPGLVAQYGNRSLEHAWQKLRAFLR